MGSCRAGCVETHTSDSEGGLRKRNACKDVNAPQLRTSAIATGTFVPERNQFIDSAAVDDRFLVGDGDVPITRGSGSAELVGDAAVARLSPYPAQLYLFDLTYRLRDLSLTQPTTIKGRNRPRCYVTAWIPPTQTIY